jgi:Na+/melibiose symporter-like transporter
MYMNDDAILVVLYGVIGVVVLIFIAYATRERLLERQTKKANLDANGATAHTWNARRGEWIAGEDS